jgi:hypothetical protein
MKNCCTTLPFGSYEVLILGVADFAVDVDLEQIPGGRLIWVDAPLDGRARSPLLNRQPPKGILVGVVLPLAVTAPIGEGVLQQ